MSDDDELRQMVLTILVNQALVMTALSTLVDSRLAEGLLKQAQIVTEVVQENGAA